MSNISPQPPRARNVNGTRASQGLHSDRVISISIRDGEQAKTLLVFRGQESHPKAQISLTMVVFRTSALPHPLTRIAAPEKQ